MTFLTTYGIKSNKVNYFASTVIAGVFIMLITPPPAEHIPLQVRLSAGTLFTFVKAQPGIQVTAGAHGGIGG